MRIDDLVCNRTSPYYILAPGYTDFSSGIKALHLLCHALNKIGQEAYVITDKTHPPLNTPLLTEEIKARHQLAGREPLVVYPEVVGGNPLNASKVIRYVLNKPGYLGNGESHYAESDFVLLFRDEFVSDAMPVDARLHLPTVDLTLFNTEGGDPSQRQGCCHYIGRYTGSADDVPVDSIEISHQNPRTPAQLAEIYKRCEVMYTYEPTAAALEASLCGCPVIYIPNEMMPVPAHSNALGLAGSGWGLSEESLALAKRTVHEVQIHYASLVRDFWKDLEIFVNKSQAYADSPRRTECLSPVNPEASPRAAQLMDMQAATGIGVAKLVTQLKDHDKFSFSSQQAKDNFYLQLITQVLDQNNIGDYFGRHHQTFRKRLDRLDAARQLAADFVTDTENRQFASQVQQEVLRQRHNELYADWISSHSLQEVDAQLHAERMIREWPSKPVFHFILFLMPGEEALLGDTLDSLAGQMYDGWCLTVISEQPAPDILWQQLPALNWLQCDAQSDPYGLVNQAAAAVSADWVSMIQPGVALVPQALLRLGDYAMIRPHWQFIYPDTDSTTATGERLAARFLPDFNLDLMRSTGYCRFGAFVRSNWLQQAGGINPYPDAEMLDVAFRVTESCGESAVGHIADVLLHYPEQATRPLSDSMLALVVRAHLDRCGVQADINSGYVDGTLRINYAFDAQQRVSIILPNRDKYEYVKECVDTILTTTRYDNFELLLIDRGSRDVDTLAFYEQLDREEHYAHVQVIHESADCSYTRACNVGASHASGDALIFIRNYIHVRQADWLERLVQQLQRAEVGVAGARQVYPETTQIRHAGYILGLGDVVGEPFNRELALFGNGYMNRALVDQNLSAVSNACLGIDATLYKAIGGMNDRDLEDEFSDVDLCLRVIESGKKVVWTPYSMVVTYLGNADIFERDDTERYLAETRRYQDARDYMLKTWMHRLVDDPAYNPNLDLNSGSAYCPANGLPLNWDIHFHDRPKILGLPVSGGSGEYRVCHPFRALSHAALAQTEFFHVNSKIVYGTSAVEMARQQPDTVVVQASIQDMQINLLRDLKEYAPDLFIVFTLDDLITDVPEKSSVYKRQKKFVRNARARLRRALSYCDRMIVSTESLRQEYADMIADIQVVPNRLQRDVWLPLSSRRGSSEKPRVGWVGAHQHQGDLEIITEVVKLTSNVVDWVFMGMCPGEIEPFVKEYHSEWVDFSQYPEKVASLNLDIAVAPLENHAFNRSKSNLRLLEYGVMGWPVICSDVVPYQEYEAPVVRVADDTESWVNAILDYVNNPDKARAAGDRLQHWVHQHFILEDHLEQWQQALLSPQKSLPQSAGQTASRQQLA